MSAMNESLAIDEEWKRINKERDFFVVEEEALNKETEDYNAQVRIVNKKENNAEDIKKLKERLAASDAREANLIERKRRLLYDIEQVNNRSRAFNDKNLDLPPKDILHVRFTSDGVPLTPQPHSKGEPLPSSPKTSQRSYSPKSAPGQAKSRSPVQGKSRSPVQGKSRSPVGEKKRLKGGAVVPPSSNPAEEGKLIDQEWARIDKEKNDLTAEDRKLDAEMDKLNARIREVNEMKNNSSQIAEVDAWQKRFDQEELSVIERRRRLLYDVQLVNERSHAYNEAIGDNPDLPLKNIRNIIFTHNKQNLTPLPY